MGTGPADSIPLLADELELVVQDGERRVRARQSLPEGFSWGPFQGSIHSEPTSPGHGEAVRSAYRGGQSPAAAMSEAGDRDRLGRGLPCAELWDLMGTPGCFWVPETAALVRGWWSPLALQAGCSLVCVCLQRCVGLQEDLGHEGNLRDKQRHREGLGAFGKDGFLLVLGMTAGVPCCRAGTSRGCWWLMLALSVRVACTGVRGRAGLHGEAGALQTRSHPSPPCSHAGQLQPRGSAAWISAWLHPHSSSSTLPHFFLFSLFFFLKLRPVYLCRIKSLINPYLPSLAPYLPLGAVCPDTRYRMIDSLKICAAFFLILHLLSKYFCSHFSSSLIEAG